MGMVPQLSKFYKMAIKENKKTGANVVKNNAIKTNEKSSLKPIVKMQEPKKEDIAKIMLELEKLKQENKDLKKSKFADLEQAKEVFARKSDILKMLNIYTSKKIRIDEGLERVKNTLEEFGNEEIKLILSWGYNEKISITGKTIIEKLLINVLTVIDEKQTELETELLEM